MYLLSMSRALGRSDDVISTKRGGEGVQRSLPLLVRLTIPNTPLPSDGQSYGTTLHQLRSVLEAACARSLVPVTSEGPSQRRLVSSITPLHWIHLNAH